MEVTFLECLNYGCITVEPDVEGTSEINVEPSTKEEIIQAVKHLNNGKAPGLDNY